MNLVITDSENKQYHPYPTFTEKSEMFICENINKINAKNKTYLTVQTDIDTAILDKKGFKMDQGLFDRLVFDYNKKLEAGEQPLDLWRREL